MNLEVAGFVFTKRQALQDNNQNQQHLKELKATPSKEDSFIATSEQENTPMEGQNDSSVVSDYPSTPLSSSKKLKRRSSIGLRGKRTVDGVCRNLIVLMMLLTRCSITAF